MNSTPTQPESESLIGAAVQRVEDESFLRGTARFTDDITPDNAAYAVVVRAPLANALISSIDATIAAGMPGVIAVLTAADLLADLKSPIPSMNSTAPFDVRNSDGQLLPDGSQPVLATSQVRYAGEPVAMVVADTVAEAQDAAEAVDITYDPLPAVMTFEEATRQDAPLLWPRSDGNRTLDWTGGNSAAVDQSFSNAARVIRCTLQNNRIAPCFMEPRAAVAQYDPHTGRYTLHAGCQGVHGLQASLLGILGLARESLKVVAPDTGGGFGARGSVYPEFALTLIAARHTGRPVRWTAERGESFLTDYQARDQLLHGELALDENGRFLALRVRSDWRHGAYLGSRNAWVMVSFLPPTLGGVYRVPHMAITMRGAFSNTTPQAAYRGIGRVESNYVMERLVDEAAASLQMDPIALRRGNLIGESDLPWRAAGGATYTTGQFERNLDRALTLADYPGLAKRRDQSRARGRCRGFGVGMIIENDGGAPSEFAEVQVSSAGRITVFAGTQDFGMGHRTLYKQVAAESLGLSFAEIDVVYGDTDRVKTGSGSHGSRSARIGGTAVVMSSEALIEKARLIAGHLLEAAGPDIDYRGGQFTIAGTDRSVSLFEVAAHCEGAGETLAGEAQFITETEAHSNGAVVCEVEVDPETGKVSIRSHCLVMDTGRAINPMIVEGQLHGGAAQGLGQAGFEAVVYDEQSGQTLSGSFMDYCIPKADDLPMFLTELNEIPEPDNPLGVKGVGECATSGSPAALVNAVMDALRPLGVTDLQMPLTPFRVWTAISSAKTSRSS